MITIGQLIELMGKLHKDAEFLSAERTWDMEYDLLGLDGCAEGRMTNIVVNIRIKLPDVPYKTNGYPAEAK